MKLFAVSLLALLAVTGGASQILAEDNIPIEKYDRSDGTYVRPPMRSAPDSSYNSNWSTYPSVNPYTGQLGTRQQRLLDANPSYGYGQGSNYGLGGSQRGRAR
jgi:hypothetical protein